MYFHLPARYYHPSIRLLSHVAAALVFGITLLSLQGIHTSAKTLYTTDGVNVRAAADASSEIRAKIESGTSVTVLGTSGNWVKISLDGVNGYIYNTLLSSKKPDTDTTSPDTEESASGTSAVSKNTSHSSDTTSDADIDEALDGVSEDRRDIVENACTHLGETYSQAKRDEAGYSDCSSLVRDVYLSVTGTFVGDTTVTQTEQMAAFLSPITDLSGVQPGDILYHIEENKNHAGIYVGDGIVINASQTAGEVKISCYDLSATYWNYRCNAISYCENQH